MKENQFGMSKQNLKSIGHYLGRSRSRYRCFGTESPQKPFTMTYQEAKVIVWRILLHRIKRQHRTLEIDKNNQMIIVNLIKYFIGDQTDSCPDSRSIGTGCDWSPHKGLLFVGGVGLGKTFLMTVMRDFCKIINHPYHQFKIKACTNVYDSINTENPIQSLSRYYRGNWCFDDLGHEPTNFKHYGNDIPFMTKVLTARYERFINTDASVSTVFTHATTNLMPKAIKAKYGERFFDRCRQLFNVVVFEGSSRRR